MPEEPKVLAWKVACVALPLSGYAWGLSFTYMTGALCLSLLFGIYSLLVSGSSEANAFLGFAKTKAFAVVLDNAFWIGKVVKSFGGGMKEKKHPEQPPAGQPVLAESRIRGSHAEIVFIMGGAMHTILVPYRPKMARSGRTSRAFVVRDGKDEEIPMAPGIPILVDAQDMGGVVKCVQSRRRFSK